MEVLQLCPRLPPAIDGIGDYAVTLANGLQQHDIHTHFMTFQQGNESVGHFSISALPTDSPQAFVDAIPSKIQAILLHYSDYPYDPKFGAPYWLVEALKAMQQQQRSLPLLIVFHEFPSFYLLKKTFYRFPWQQQVAWRLANLANGIVTNNAVTKTILAKRLQQPIFNLPVFSNIGELSHPTPLNQRQKRLIVFGTPGRRARIYQRSRAMLIRSCQLLGIEEICDVGPSLGLEYADIAGIPLVQKGEQTAEAISQLLSDSLAGMVYSTDNGRLAKSGVFATYCAHGLVPIVTQEQSPIMDGLQAQTQFLFAGLPAQSLSMERLQAIADEAHHWYSQHNQANTVQCFASALKAISSTSNDRHSS